MTLLHKLFQRLIKPRCTCPTECDCQDFEAGLVSNECPEHNDRPRPALECPVHGEEGDL